MMNLSSGSAVLNVLRLKSPKLLLLQSCSTISRLKIIHAHMIRTYLIFDSFAVSRLIAFCIEHTPTLLDYATRVFCQVQSPNLFMFNALIRGYSLSENPEKGLELYVGLCRFGLVPDNLTFPFVIKSCTQMGCIDTGVQAHAQAILHGFDSDVYVQNSLVHMYSSLDNTEAATQVFRMMGFLDVASWTSMISGFCKCGDVDSARELFDKMPERNLFTWSTMISGYAKNECYGEAVELFHLLLKQGVLANETVMVSVISSCGHLGALELGERAHKYVVQNGLTLNVILGTATIEMYARCGSLDKAVQVFNEMEERDILTWTALIAGFAMHGLGERVVYYYSAMLDTGLTPRDITFTAVLSGCSRGGFVEKGFEIFQSMGRDYGIEPRVEHYGCMVDLLGRAGKLEEAERFILELPVKANAPIWGALVGACRIHKRMDIAERVGQVLIQLLPEHGGYYVLLSNIYARANKWDDVDNLRRIMKESGVRKEPGWSLIEINGKMHRFTMGDKSHLEICKIEKTWEEILRKIRPAGYSGNIEDALHDIDEEEKESALHKHSEKLAIAFGIMKTISGTTIRIVKNLRVCEDCHRATKLISLVFHRELIVRDRNRFHHFKDGECSCDDFW